MTALGPNDVLVRRLRAPHGEQGFATFRPLDAAMVDELARAVGEAFDALGGASLLKPSRDVYLKPNVVGTKPYAFTRPELVEAVVRYWQRNGARRVFVIEGCTQANQTRVVFELTGYAAMCARTGAVPVFLDEEPGHVYPCTGKRPAAEEPGGYDRVTLRLPRTVHQRLIVERDQHLYVDLPKLKTHSMSVVTLGVKNQWGFPLHEDRAPDHNHNLHHKLVDVLAHVRPDVTLIEGIEGTIHGHYPAAALADRSVKPLRVLLAGRNVVAVDVVGARIFGKRIEDVPHLAIAIERGLSGGVRSERDVTLVGDVTAWDGLDLLGEHASYGGAYPDDLAAEWPADVRRVQGTELACREGCVNNALANLQILSFDHGGQGGWTLVMGKGFDDATVDALVREARPVLLVGPCAVAELAPRLREQLGARKVFTSDECNDLRAVVESMCHLMKVDPRALVPAMSAAKGLLLLGQAKLHGSTARVTNPLAHLLKLH